MNSNGRDLRQGSDVTFLDALRRSPPQDWGVGMFYVALSLLPTGNGYRSQTNGSNGNGPYPQS